MATTVTFKFSLGDRVTVRGVKGFMFVICQIKSDSGRFYLLRREDATKLHVAESELEYAW